MVEYHQCTSCDREYECDAWKVPEVCIESHRFGKCDDCLKESLKGYKFGGTIVKHADGSQTFHSADGTKTVHRKATPRQKAALWLLRRLVKVKSFEP